MVDSIKNISSSPSGRPSVSSLKNSFQSLSSGKVSEKPPTNGSVSPEVLPSGEPVSISKEAVKSLAQAQGNSGTGESFAPPELYEDIANLKSEIDRVRDRMDVLSENLNSSSAKLTDVDAAQSQAVKTGTAINFGSPKALDAHSNLSFDKVAKLLMD